MRTIHPTILQNPLSHLPLLRPAPVHFMLILMNVMDPANRGTLHSLGRDVIMRNQKRKPEQNLAFVIHFFSFSFLFIEVTLVNTFMQVSSVHYNRISVYTTARSPPKVASIGHNTFNPFTRCTFISGNYQSVVCRHFSYFPWSPSIRPSFFQSMNSTITEGESRAQWK